MVAMGGMLWSVVRRLRAGLIPVHRCAACHRPTSRAYPACRHCGFPGSGEPPVVTDQAP